MIKEIIRLPLKMINKAKSLKRKSYLYLISITPIALLIVLNALLFFEIFYPDIIKNRVQKIIIVIVVLNIIVAMTIVFVVELIKMVNVDLHKKHKHITKLKEENRIDPLTGALSRKYFFKIVKSHKRRLLSFEEKCDESMYSCLVFVDIDHFKEINDTYGHNVGDEVLAKFCEFLKSSLRKCDRIGRFGGEEFVILIKRSNKNESFTVIDKIRQRVSETPFSSQNIHIQMSAGIVEIHCDQELKMPETEISISKESMVDVSDDIKPLVIKADMAMYQAKESGRNRVVLA